MSNISPNYLSKISSDLYVKLSPLLKTTIKAMRDARPIYERSFTPQGAVLLTSVPLVTFFLVVAYKRYYGVDDNLVTIDKQINSKAILKEVEKKYREQLGSLDKTIEELMQDIKHGMARVNEEITEVRARQELTVNDDVARKIGHDNMHARINDLLQNTNRIAKCQDRNANRLMETSQRLEELEKSFREMDDSKKEVDPDMSQLPTLKKSLDTFQGAIMGEVEEYLRTEVTKLTRQVRGDMSTMKEENFSLNESAVAQEQFLSQELVDMQSLMNDMERRIKSQMFDMEQRLRSRHATPDGSQEASSANSPRDASVGNNALSPVPSQTIVTALYQNHAAYSCPATPIAFQSSTSRTSNSLAAEMMDGEIRDARKSYPSKPKPPSGHNSRKGSTESGDGGDADFSSIRLKPSIGLMEVNIGDVSPSSPRS